MHNLITKQEYKNRSRYPAITEKYGFRLSKFKCISFKEDAQMCYLNFMIVYSLWSDQFWANLGLGGGLMPSSATTFRCAYVRKYIYITVGSR